MSLKKNLKNIHSDRHSDLIIIQWNIQKKNHYNHASKFKVIMKNMLKNTGPSILRSEVEKALMAEKQKGTRKR